MMPEDLQAATARGSRYRWRIIALLFFAATINYLDRSVLGILAPVLQDTYGWTEIGYSRIVTAFQVAYGLGVFFSGKLLDRFGSRIVFALAVGLWSLAGAAHALARTVLGFSIARFFLGLGESANFPASVKTVAEWFPQKERAFVTGLFNAGSTVGAVAAPLIVPWITIRYGWEWAFIITGSVGFIWLLFWLKIYTLPEKNKKISAEELAYIQAGREKMPEKISWLGVITKKPALIICMARFLTDPVWWFLLFWLPKFLDTRYNVSISDVGLPLVVIYLAADLGGIGGGWLSSFLIKKGKGVNKARKNAMLVCALFALPVIGIASGPGLWVSVLCISLACAAHQGWAANIYTLVSDIFPENAVATVVGFSTFVAVIGSTLAATAIGWVLERTGSYSLIFSVAGCMYVAAWVLIRLGIPVIKRV